MEIMCNDCGRVELVTANELANGYCRYCALEYRDNPFNAVDSYAHDFNIEDEDFASLCEHLS